MYLQYNSTINKLLETVGARKECDRVIHCQSHLDLRQDKPMAGLQCCDAQIRYDKAASHGSLKQTKPPKANKQRCLVKLIEHWNHIGLIFW